ncbi:MAG: extracellular solute-binding protein [Rectinemataceae bacterium]|nr:extracellular solute-binding protein [Rectinemataceae bacterium]
MKSVLCLVALAFVLVMSGYSQAATVQKQSSATFSYWVQLNAAHVEILKNWNDTASMKEFEKKTGVHMNFIHPPVGQEVQSFNLMLASGDLPDMIQEREGNLYYPGGPDKAVSDGVYLDLTKLIDQYAPNYKKWLAKNDDIARLTVTDTGKRWGIYHVTDGAEPAWTGYAIRKDWLDDLGLKAPVTLDDWRTVLKAFKEKKNAEAPLLVFNTGVPAYNHIISAFDIGGAFYQVKGKVSFGPIQPAYRDYLALMNQWYKEGLLDPDFMGRTDPGFQFNAPINLVATGKSGLFPIIWGRAANAYVLRGDVKNNPAYYLQAVQAPKKTAGQQIHLNYASYEVREAVAITKACKDPIAAVKYLDQMFSTEGSLIINYGAEGDSFTMKNGVPIFTEKVTKPAGGLTAQQSLAKTVRWDGPGVVDYKRMWQVYEASGQGAMLKALQVWEKDDISYVLSPVTMNQTEAIENSNIMPDITTYVTEMTVKFIIGREPLANFPAFVKQINSMKIDRAIQIQQAALDRFNARK